MRGYLRQLLGQHYVVRLAANGAEALAALREDRPDLVLADIMMPELDGYGLLRTVRGDPAGGLARGAVVGPRRRGSHD